MSEVNFTVNQEALAVIQNSSIEANFDEVKAALSEMVAPYASMIVTEDGIADAKADRAKLNKVTARIEDVRKTVKKAYNEPLSKFEAKCKELVAIVTDGSVNLDRQISAFEDAEKKQKIDALHAEFDKMADDDLQGYLPWGVVNNPKFANKTFSYEAALAEITAAVDGARNDLSSIRGMGGDDTPYLLDVYRQTRDLSAVVRKASEIKTMRQREEQLEREEARRREIAEALSESAKKVADELLSEVDEDIVTVTFKVVCTKTKLAELGRYMQENGIKYSRA